MSDDDERRRPDETGEFFPFAEVGENRPIGGPPKDDRTEQMPRATAAPDSTRALPAAADDATQVTSRAPQSDATSVLPVTADPGTRTESYNRSTDNWADDSDPVWSGRAGVNPRRPGYDDDTRTDWAAVPADEPRGRWWTPIAVGIVALLLLALLGWGIFLIAQAGGSGDATPAVTVSPAAPATTTTTTTATTEPTTTPPTTEPTTTQPTTAPPGDVTVPALKGLSSQEARGALYRMGLNYRLRFVTSDSPAGTVIDSDPAEGQQVPADTVITLIIAAEPATPTTPAQTPTEPTGQDED